MAPPRKFHILQPEDFACLLAWLDADRERAGELYEKIRWRLVSIFAARGCPVPEDLADETIDRVARRVADVRENYVGDKALYFLGVGNNVHHEYLKRPQLTEPPPPDNTDKERTHACLENCLDKLPAGSKQLILRYYGADKQAKIDLRKQLAEGLGLSLNTLRLRALRIRESLQKCIENCRNE